ncbi:MAG: arylamine N-acetyltransferase [Proteobacteria bacterium]|nr:arylamine N-acetyltransferase [Pseudomonadota bacterium]
MKSETFTLSRYLERIGYTGDIEASTDTLAALMRHQLFTVPFENLDVQAGKIVSMNPDEIAEKILAQPRGGYCYEVNGLFAMALAALSIPYRFIAARPMFYPVKRPKTHMAIVAEVEGKQWLCDLGFGSYGLRAPLAIDAINEVVSQDYDQFMLTQDGGDYVLKAWVDGEWANQYGFNLSPHEFIDFMPANYLNSTHPDAIFVQKRLVVKHHPQGRDILLGNRLKSIQQNETTITLLEDDQIDTMLKTRFGLSVA